MEMSTKRFVIWGSKPWEVFSSRNGLDVLKNMSGGRPASVVVPSSMTEKIEPLVRIIKT